MTQAAAPAVSVVIPAFNRADTILRSVQSVIAQTFQDWEAIVVDDGSTDDSGSIVTGLDPRVRVIRQDNQGLSAARNTGVAAARGAYLAFLDSDDEWRPEHLALCIAFLRAFPDQQFVTTELIEDFGHGRTRRHYYAEWARDYPEMARLAGSRALDLPAGETDPYLRAFETREPIGPWGADIAARAGHSGGCLYTGQMFERLRWGYIMWMQGTVLTRAAAERVGAFDTRFRSVGDFGYLAGLCRHYRTNYISIPTCIKHEFTPSVAGLKQEHLAGGRGMVVSAREMLRWFDELFWNARRDDPELSALRAIKLVMLGRMCFDWGLRDDALRYLQEARAAYPSKVHLAFITRCVRHLPDRPWARAAWRHMERVEYAVRGVSRGDLSVADFARKAARYPRRAV
jgi:glycosyltransferase involved in cell wall biosynthesis